VRWQENGGKKMNAKTERPTRLEQSDGIVPYCIRFSISRLLLATMVCAFALVLLQATCVITAAIFATPLLLFVFAANRSTAFRLGVSTVLSYAFFLMFAEVVLGRSGARLVLPSGIIWPVAGWIIGHLILADRHPPSKTITDDPSIPPVKKDLPP